MADAVRLAPEWRSNHPISARAGREQRSPHDAFLSGYGAQVYRRDTDTLQGNRAKTFNCLKSSHLAFVSGRGIAFAIVWRRNYEFTKILKEVHSHAGSTAA
jgi:hypothetical protein